MSASNVCPEVQALWFGLLSSDRVDVDMSDVAEGLADHALRHGCDVLDIEAVLVDLRLLSTADPILIAELGSIVESVGERCSSWRDFLLSTLANIVVSAADSGDADAVAARRELRRLCGTWDLPGSVAAWSG